MPGPLAGFSVLEMANFISGPYAATLLADLGADVVKVEMPGAGDPFRGWSERGGTLLPQFAAYNRGKRGISLNVQLTSGQELYRKLASTADVVIENFRPGTLDRLGVGYDTLQQLNPKLVYCAISGMGSSGPYRDRPTYDAIAQAMSGLMSQFTDLHDPEPIGPAMADQLTGIYASYAVLAALVARGVNGRGQKIDMSMLSASMAFMTMPIADYLLTGEASDLHSRPRRSQSYAFVAADGLPFAVHLSSPPKFWKGLAAAAGRPELVEDPRFKTKADRIKHYSLLHDELAKVFRTKPRTEWLARLEEQDVPAAPIYSIPEVLADPQVQHLGMVQTFRQGEQSMRLVGYPARFEGTPCEPDLGPPDVGEHNRVVFGALGYTDADLERLHAEGAI